MLRGILLLVMLILLAACAAAPSASPSPSPSATNASPEMSDTPLPTRTISNEDLTAFATYRPTMPPAFTPTLTPTLTLTFTPTVTLQATATPTPLPELLICPGFDASPYAPQGREMGVSLTIPMNLSVLIEIYEMDTGELGSSGLVTDREIVVIMFDPRYIPAGNYRWQASLQDASRTGLCPLEGEFTITALPTAEATAELTAESTENPNATASTPTPSRIRETPQRTGEAR